MYYFCLASVYLFTHLKGILEQQALAVSVHSTSSYGAYLTCHWWPLSQLSLNFPK